MDEHLALMTRMLLFLDNTEQDSQIKVVILR